MEEPASKLMRMSAAPIVPYRWRDLSPASLVWFYTQAIRELGTPQTFSLRLTHDVRHRMETTSASQRDYIALRLRKWLPKTPLFFVIEDAPGEVVHVHGLLATTHQTKDDIMCALRKVAGDRRKIPDKRFRIFYDTKAVHVGDVTWTRHHSGQREAFGWTQYSIKGIKAASRRGIPASALIYCPNSVNRKARLIHLACCSDPIAKAA